MSQIDRRFRLIFDSAAADDLTRVKREDSWAHAQIFALLEEYNSGTFPAEELIDEYFESDEIENVVPFWNLQKDHLNVFRIKLIKVARWCVLVAGDHQAREVAVLAIMNRDQNYESDKALVARIRASYEALGFKALGR
jgi:hypothetical protein